MEKIIQYKAFDGTIHATKALCAERDKLVLRVRKIVSKLVPVPSNDLNFQNGEGYIQQKESVVDRAIMELLELGMGMFGNHLSFELLGRYIDDSGNEALREPYLLLDCIDYQYRSWGQQYYARNPDEGKQIPYIKR